MKRLSILGSTGSIGTSALDLIDLYPDRFQIVGLAAHKNAHLLHEQALKYNPKIIALHDQKAAESLKQQLPNTTIVSGLEGVIEIATHHEVDLVLAAITGAAGLIPTYQALSEGKDVALANKETLVMAGDLITELAGKSRLLPIDSEHSALHQCLRGSGMAELQRLVLTASGGPFLSTSKEHLAHVSVEEALDHPTWNMGKKITIDSATLMNKGLEVIEAHHLFSVNKQRISVVIHPQSIIHSMVEFIDGTILAQMSITDMRSAILYALSYPERWDSNLPRLDLLSIEPLEFLPPDTEKFPCLRLAYQALEDGGSCPITLNAANEIAVQSFLDETIPFPAIAETIEETLNRYNPISINNLDTVLRIDQEARRIAHETIRERSLH